VFRTLEEQNLWKGILIKFLVVWSVNELVELGTGPSKTRTGPGRKPMMTIRPHAASQGSHSFWFNNWNHYSCKSSWRKLQV